MPRAKVLEDKLRIDSIPVKLGAVVELDQDTFDNLVRDGRVAPAKDDEPDPEDGDGLDELTVKELHEKAGALNIAHSGLNKPDLINAIRAASLPPAE